MKKVKKFKNFLESDNWFNAIKDEDIKEIKELIDNGFDVNTKNSSDNTALLLLCDDSVFTESLNTQLIELLIENDADPNIVCEEKFTPFQMITMNKLENSEKIVQFFIDNGALIDFHANDSSALILSAIYDNYKNLFVLLENNPDWCFKDYKNNYFIDYLPHYIIDKIYTKYPDKKKKCDISIETNKFNI